MNKNLNLKAQTTQTCLAVGAELSAAAMRCGYDGFEQSSFTQPNSTQMQLGAEIKIQESLRGLEKLIYLSSTIIQSMVKEHKVEITTIPIYLCLQELNRPSYFSFEELQEKLFANLITALDVPNISNSSRAYLEGRCGFTTALKQAQIDIYENGDKEVLIVSVDSLLNSASLAYYGGGLYGEGCRLLTDNNSNGFIPGEAASAVLLSKPTSEENEIVISGVGMSKEIATIYNEDELLRAKGLSEAIMEASNQAELPIHETAFD